MPGIEATRPRRWIRFKAADGVSVAHVLGAWRRWWPPSPARELVPGRKLPLRPLVEIAEVGDLGLVVRLDGAFPDIRLDAWAGIPNEPITLDALMARFCERRSSELRRFRRHALLGAARNGKVTLPPSAGPYKSAQRLPDVASPGAALQGARSRGRFQNSAKFGGHHTWALATFR